MTVQKERADCDQPVRWTYMKTTLGLSDFSRSGTKASTVAAAPATLVDIVFMMSCEIGGRGSSLSGAMPAYYDRRQHWNRCRAGTERKGMR